MKLVNGYNVLETWITNTPRVLSASGENRPLSRGEGLLRRLAEEARGVFGEPA